MTSYSPIISKNSLRGLVSQICTKSNGTVEIEVRPYRYPHVRGIIHTWEFRIPKADIEKQSAIKLETGRTHEIEFSISGVVGLEVKRRITNDRHVRLFVPKNMQAELRMADNGICIPCGGIRETYSGSSVSTSTLKDSFGASNPSEESSPSNTSLDDNQSLE